jgi:WS/DGAT/MGAT family acyltransferase
VSANRVVEAVGFPLGQMQRARAKVDGATINDLFLAVVGGALRRYLESKDELPAESLVALMPMSVREEGRGRDGGNEVGGVPVPLRTDIADPLERLRAVQRDAVAAKRDSEILGRAFLKSVLDELPSFASETFLRYVVYPQLNVTVSNVRGPEVPLYVAGARLVHFYPVSIATDYIGLNHTGFSYNGILWITAVACRNMMPDPAFYADCLRRSFDELMTAIDKLPAPVTMHHAAAKPPVRKTKPAPAKPKARVAAGAKRKAAAPLASRRKAKARRPDMATA